MEAKAPGPSKDSEPKGDVQDGMRRAERDKPATVLLGRQALISGFTPNKLDMGFYAADSNFLMEFHNLISISLVACTFATPYKWSWDDNGNECPIDAKIHQASRCKYAAA
jgi:hypothetical protein